MNIVYDSFIENGQKARRIVEMEKNPEEQCMCPMSPINAKFGGPQALCLSEKKETDASIKDLDALD